MGGPRSRGPVIAVGQSGGGTPVINASLAGVIAEAREAGAARLLGMVNGVRGLLEERFLDLLAQPDGVLAALPYTPSAALGLCRYKLDTDQTAQAVEVLRRWRVDAFLYIGGNDSAETTRAIAAEARRQDYSLACVAIPKTIDNDLPATDHTPGYGSAARLVASLARDLALDAWAMRREEAVRILEVYGRDTGWLAAATALGRDGHDGGAHLVLVPERPFGEEQFLVAIEERLGRHGYVTVAVSEMLRHADGSLVGGGAEQGHDAFGHAETRRPGEFLRALIQSRLGVRAKDDRPGSIQKVAADLASQLDREEAFNLGREAVRAALAGESEVMVALEREADEPYACRIGRAPLAAVAGKTRPLPDAFLDAAGQPTAAFCRYARPLLGGPLRARARIEARLASPPSG